MIDEEIDLKEEEIEVLRKSENNPVLKSQLIEELKKSKDPIRWFKILNERRYFNPENNPSPIKMPDGNYRIPFWHELSLLENYCTIDSFITNKEITNKVEEIIDSIIEYRNESGKKIDNYMTDWMLIKIIFNLPDDKIKIEYVNYVKLAFESKWNASLLTGEMINNVLPKIIQNKSSKLLLNLLNILLDYKVTAYDESKYTDVISIMEEYWFNEMINKYKGNFYEICNYDLLNIVENKIIELIEYKNTEFSIGQIVTIYDSDQNLSESYELNLIRLLRDLILFLETDQIKKDISRYLKSEHSIFRRIAFYLADIKYSEFDYILWSYKENPLEDVEIKHELWKLFNNNVKKFNENQINKVINWIETHDYYISEDVKKDVELVDKIIAYKKKEWYYALLTDQPNEIQKKFDYYNSTNPIKLEHPGYLIWSSGVMTISPYKEVETDIIQLENDELVQHLNSLQDSKDTILGIEPEFSIRQSVQENPSRFTTDMIPFYHLKPRYLYDLFIGLKSAWKQKKNFKWDELFIFIDTLIPVLDKGTIEHSFYDYKNWTIQQIAELIEEGCKDDEHSFSIEFIPISANILVKLDEICNKKVSFSKKIIDHVINSPKGSIYSAMMQVSLKKLRHKGKKIWLQEIQDHFSSIITNLETQSFEFFFVIGRFLPNILTMNKNWILGNLDIIFSKSNEEIWSASFQGYLSGQPGYRGPYEILVERSDFLKAIFYNFENDMMERSLMNTIATFYLLDERPPKDNELIKKIIKKQDQSQFSHLTNYYWRHSEKLTETQRDLVLDLWEATLNSIYDKEKSKEIYNSLSYLVSVIDELKKKSIDVLLDTIKYMEIQAFHPILLDNLLRLMIQNPKVIGEAYVLIAEKDDYPYAKRDTIKKFVEELYKLDENEIANQICRIYTNKGFLFLKETFEKYN